MDALDRAKGREGRRDEHADVFGDTDGRRRRRSRWFRYHREIRGSPGRAGKSWGPPRVARGHTRRERPRGRGRQRPGRPLVLARGSRERASGPSAPQDPAVQRRLGGRVDANGHGTHVVNTILGEAVVGSPIGAASTTAWLRRRSSSTTSVGVGLFSYRRRWRPTSTRRTSTARVHSDGWGNDAPLYNGLAREVDEYAWSHRDFLPCAGNFGLAGARTMAGRRRAKTASPSARAWAGPDRTWRALSWGTARR